MKKLIIAGLLLSTANIASAATVAVNAQIKAVLQTDENVFGACMALLDVSPRDQGLDCHSWVTFSCSGDFNTKEVGYRKFDVAQMSYALEKKRSMLFINDEKKHNGYCFVERIDAY